MTASCKEGTRVEPAALRDTLIELAARPDLAGSIHDVALLLRDLLFPNSASPSLQPHSFAADPATWLDAGVIPALAQFAGRHAELPVWLCCSCHMLIAAQLNVYGVDITYAVRRQSHPVLQARGRGSLV